MKENPDKKKYRRESRSKGYFLWLFVYLYLKLKQNFIKLSLLGGYISINKIDIICLSETYLDSSIPSDDDNLELPGYNLVRADNPTNTKRGGVCIYYHNSLPLKVIDIQFLNECINFEIRIGGKLCSFFCLYRSLSYLEMSLKYLLIILN